MKNHYLFWKSSHKVEVLILSWVTLILAKQYSRKEYSFQHTLIYSSKEISYQRYDTKISDSREQKLINLLLRRKNRIINLKGKVDQNVHRSRYLENCSFIQDVKKQNLKSDNHASKTNESTSKSRIEKNVYLDKSQLLRHLNAIKVRLKSRKFNAKPEWEHFREWLKFDNSPLTHLYFAKHLKRTPVKKYNVSQIIINEGRNVTLTCPSTANNSSKRWKIGYQEFKFDRARMRKRKNGDIRIFSLEQTDSGVYVCWNQRGNLTTVSSIRCLAVKNKKPIIINTGASYTIPCKSRFFPNVYSSWGFVLKWYHDNVEVKSITDFKNQDYIIENARRSDSGVWRCISICPVVKLRQVTYYALLKVQPRKDAGSKGKALKDLVKNAQNKLNKMDFRDILMILLIIFVGFLIYMILRKKSKKKHRKNKNKKDEPINLIDMQGKPDDTSIFPSASDPIPIPKSKDKKEKHHGKKEHGKKSTKKHNGENPKDSHKSKKPKVEKEKKEHKSDQQNPEKPNAPKPKASKSQEQKPTPEKSKPPDTKSESSKSQAPAPQVSKPEKPNTPKPEASKSQEQKPTPEKSKPPDTKSDTSKSQTPAPQVSKPEKPKTPSKPEKPKKPEELKPKPEKANKNVKIADKSKKESTKSTSKKPPKADVKTKETSGGGKGSKHVDMKGDAPRSEAAKLPGKKDKKRRFSKRITKDKAQQASSASIVANKSSKGSYIRPARQKTSEEEHEELRKRVLIEELKERLRAREEYKKRYSPYI